MNSKIDIHNFIDSRRISGFQLLVYGLCSIVVLLDGLDALAIGYVAPTIVAAWGISNMALGPVFAAGLVGIMVGALILGTAADRFGRRPVLVISVATFGVFSLLTATCDSATSLLAMRFLTGMGLGGAMPIAISLTSEYAPARRRATVVMTMFCGFTLGGAFGGLMAASLIELYGWQAVFIAGGLLPLVLSVLLMWKLPESIRFLVSGRNNGEQISLLLRKIDPQWVSATAVEFTSGQDRPPQSHVAELFRNGRAAVTLLLWLVFFMSLFELFFIANWLPTIMRGRGFTLTDALTITIVYQVGGTVGTLVLGRFIDTRAPYRVLAWTFLLGSVFVLGLGVSNSGFTTLCMIAAGAGFFSIGAQVGSNSLAATAYPTAIRGTGVGWALGVGRVGAIVSSVLNGALLNLAPSPLVTFSIAALPVLIAGLAAFAIGARSRSSLKAALAARDLASLHRSHEDTSRVELHRSTAQPPPSPGG